MTVLWSDRSTPLAKNAANTAFSDGILLAYDFTNHDSAHTAGVPWIFQGATNPTFALTGTQPVSTVGGEPGAVAALNSLWSYNQSPFSNAADYGFQVGTGDFTLAIRVSTPSSVPANSNSRELIRLNGSAGTALTVTLLTNPSVGYYVSAVGSTCCPLGATNGTPTYFPADTVLMVFVRKVGGITTIYTQNVTTQANTVVRYVAGAAATTPLDATWVSGVRMNFQGAVTTGVAMQAMTFWNVGHSQTALNTIGKDFYDSQANGAVANSIAITSPTAGSSINASAVLSGTYVGDAPTGVQAQHGAGSWVSGTGMTIGSGAWSGAFAIPQGSAAALRVRETNAPAVVSPDVANITVVGNSITFAGNGVSLDEVVAHRIFQRNASNQATVKIKLTYTGSPTGFEYQYDGGAWTALGGAPSGGTHEASVTLSGPSQGSLSVRFANNTEVVATLSGVGVSRGMMVGGQSQHVGGGAGTYVPPVAPGAHPAWVASILDKTGMWRPNVETETDPFSKTTNASNYGAATATYSVQASSATATNSYFGRLATLFMAGGEPIAFVPSAMGSTTLESWAPSTSTATLFGAMRARALAIGVQDLTFWQGEANCSNGTTRATHETNLNAFVDAWKSYFPDAKIYLINLNATGNTVGSGGTGATDTGFNAIHAAIENVALTNANVTGYADMNGAFSSGLHYSTAPEITTIAQRAYDAMNPGVPISLTASDATTSSTLPSVVVTQEHTIAVAASSVSSTLPNVTLGSAPAAIAVSASRTAKFGGENRMANFDSEQRIATF